MLPPPGFRDVVLCGTGATSRVFRATAAASGRTVALKRLHRQLAQAPEALSRLRRELEALGKLRHPSIVPVFDVIRWQGDPTIVMDYVAGQDLKEVIADGGPMSFAEAERILRALLEVLLQAHGAGVLHRDVKPQNVRLGEDGRMYLLDFGSARLDASSQLTTTGTSVGTPDYMAPELFAGPVYDPRADLYGIGATVFEALTGRAPQLADSLTELAFRRTHEDPPPVASLRESTPPALAQVVDRCLARAPEDRYATAAHALWALDHPAEERRFRARRSSLPPCLHCGAAIPPESNLCSACGSDHPFCYRPGQASVNLVAIRDPSRVSAELVATFPELEETMPHLAERMAAVGAGPQRVVSMIAREEALALADRLRDAGADCQLEEDPGLSRWSGRTALGAGIAMVLATIAAAAGLSLDLAAFVAFVLVLPPLLAMLAERWFAMERASQGILSRARGSSAQWIPFALSIAPPLMIGAGLALPLEIAGEQWLPDLSRPLFAGAALTALIGLAARTVRFAKRRPLESGSAEPNALERLRSAFSLRSRALAPLRRRMATALVLAAVALVPLELGAAHVLRSVVPSFWSVWRESQLILSGSEVHTERYDLLAVMDNAPVVADPIVADEPEPALLEPIDVSDWTPALSNGPILPPWLDARAQAIIGSIAALDLALLALLLHRRRRFAREGRRLAAEIELPLSSVGKTPPTSRTPARHLSAADRLAERRTDDPFLQATKRRAAELAHHLDHGEIDRLGHALDRVRARAERSHLARCILETDADLGLRFELLRLAGTMEAKAAERWAATLPEES